MLIKPLKHLLLVGTLLTGMAAYADDASWLTFTMADGSELSVDSSNLVINYADGVLHLSSPATSQNLAVAGIKSMRFTSSTSAIEGLDLDNHTELKDFYTLAGVKAGSFDSIEAARKSLSSGAYIIKCGNNSVKVIF